MSSYTLDEEALRALSGAMLPENSSTKISRGMAQLLNLKDLSPRLIERWRALHDEWRISDPSGHVGLLMFLEAEVERIQRIVADELSEVPRDDLPFVGDYLRGLRSDGLPRARIDGDE